MDSSHLFNFEYTYCFEPQLQDRYFIGFQAITKLLQAVALIALSHRIFMKLCRVKVTETETEAIMPQMSSFLKYILWLNPIACLLMTWFLGIKFIYILKNYSWYKHNILD